MSKRYHGAAVLAVLMAGAVWASSAWRPTHFIADDKPRVVLDELFAREVGGWTVDRSIVPIQPSPDVQKEIDATYDQTLARTYRNAQGQRIMLSVAYGRRGMNMHRPEICYPAQGFQILNPGERGSLMLEQTEVSVTRLVAGSGSRIEPITYWLVVGDRVTHFGGQQKLVATLRYGLVGQIPDGMLIRVSSMNADSGIAFALHERFVADMFRAISEPRRRLVLGLSDGKPGRIP